MATRKKIDKQSVKPVEIVEPPKKVKKTKSNPVQEIFPKVVKGNHLTVTTYEDGRTELVWDDAALLKEVQGAILAYELENKKPAVKAKSTRKKKAENA